MEVILVVHRGGCLLTHRVNRAAGSVGAGLRAVLEAPAFVAGFDDLAMMGQAVEQRRGHLGGRQRRRAIRRRRGWR